MGRSGCGKGTQVKLLMEYLKKTDPARDIFYLETGAGVREFNQQSSYTSELSKKVYVAGGLQPEFLTIWVWSSLLVKYMKPNIHFIIDGTPRRLDEARALDSAFRFYNHGKPFYVYLDVSREWSKKRLLARNRVDDHDADIDKRLNWFESDVLPAVEYYRNNPNYNFLSVNGEQTPEEVHKEILAKIALVEQTLTDGHNTQILGGNN